MPVRSRHATSAKVRESPRDLRVLRWLKRKPVPAVVVGETSDGEELRVKIAGKGGERPNWADAARALHDCANLVALDVDGDTVRTLEHDDDDPELRAETQREERAPSSYGSALLAIDVPRLVEKISESMANVSRTAAEQQSQAHAEAFKQMGNVLSVAMNLLSRLEAHIAELEQAAEPPPPAQESPGEGRDQMAMQLLSQLTASRGSNGGLSIDLPALLQQIPPEQLRELVGMISSSKGEGGADGSH